MMIAFLSPRNICGYKSGTYTGRAQCQAFVRANSSWNGAARAFRTLNAMGKGLQAVVEQNEAIRVESAELVHSLREQVANPAGFDHVFFYVPGTSYKEGLESARDFPQDGLTLVYCTCYAEEIDKARKELLPDARYMVIGDCGGGATMSELIEKFLSTGLLPS
jgi:hypothetical protein